MKFFFVDASELPMTCSHLNLCSCSSFSTLLLVPASDSSIHFSPPDPNKKEEIMQVRDDKEEDQCLHINTKSFRAVHNQILQH